MQTISVLVVTRNEERNIRRCLESVRWADEIIIVDSFSRDNTVNLAREYTDKIFQYEYPGYTKQVMNAMTHATGDWVLIVDADEEVSSELKDELTAALNTPPSVAGYEIPRKPSAFGKWIEHGGWFPDYQFRFFRRNECFMEDREIHGGMSTHGRRSRLSGVLYHHTYQTIFDYVEKMNEYTSLEVSNRIASNRAEVPRWYNLLLSPLSHFLRMFLSRKGYKDGFHGFVLSLLDATYSFLLYAKVWEFRMRASRGMDLPPITNKDFTKLKLTR